MAKINKFMKANQIFNLLLKISLIILLLFFGFLIGAKISWATYCTTGLSGCPSNFSCPPGQGEFSRWVGYYGPWNCGSACSYNNSVITSCDMYCAGYCVDSRGIQYTFDTTFDCNYGEEENCSPGTCVSLPQPHCEINEVAPPPTSQPPPPSTPVNNNLPYGYLDGVNCNKISGWAVDNDCTAANSISPGSCEGIWVHLYDGQYEPGRMPFAIVFANDSSPDVLAAGYGDNSNRFSYTIPDSSDLKNGQAHYIYAYAIDYQPTGASPNPNPRLSESSSGIGNLTCTPITPPISCPTCPPTVNLNAPPLVQAPNLINLTWNSSSADSCSASGAWSGSKSTTGQESISKPRGDYTFNLSCTGSNGTASDSVSVRVIQSPDCSFTANPTTINPSQSSVLSWNCQNAIACLIDQGIGLVNISGSQTVHPSQTTNYTLNCFNNNTVGTYNLNVIVSRLTEIIPN